MENVVEMPRNSGIMPRIETNSSASDNNPDIEELQIDNEPSEQFNEPVVAENFEDKPYSHIRVPELHRSGLRVLMAIAGACGAAAGAVMMFSGRAEGLTVGGGFKEIFMGRILVGAAMLAAEFLLGYFAFGDWLVWTIPLFSGMGAGLRICADGSWVTLVGTAMSLCAVIFAAARSADFSQLLLRLSHGGTVYMESEPRKTYAVGFLGYSVLIAAGAIVEGISAIL